MGGFDELLEASGRPRAGAAALCDYFATLAPAEMEARHRAVDAAIMAAGITFTVYSEAGNIDRAWPFDVVPRILAKSEWDHIEAGLKQRLKALNLFIDDIYPAQRHSAQRTRSRAAGWPDRAASRQSSAAACRHQASRRCGRCGW